MNKRAFALFASDILAVGLTWLVVFQYRFGLEVPDDFWRSALFHLTWVMPTYVLIFLYFHLYSSHFRFASLQNLRQILFACAAGGLTVAAGLGFLRGGKVPLSILVLHPLCVALVTVASRFVYRSWKEHRLYSFRHLSALPVFVIGSNDSAPGLLRTLQHSPNWYVIGIIDDDSGAADKRILNVPVLGQISEIGKIAQSMEVSHAIIAISSGSLPRRRKAAEHAVAAGLTVMAVSALDEILWSNRVLPELRRIELDDLLGRDPIKLDTTAMACFIGGSVALVTGAGGSIGLELSRQIARFRPSLLVLLELSEFALYRIEQEFEAMGYDVPLVCLVGDIKDAARLRDIMRRYQPQVVFHAAAYKHVPLMESDNAWEAVRNNALGTLNVARVALETGVEKFVLISTDKAVNPTSVMGATKRLAEMVCQGLQGRGKTRFVTVRFGNVLGSTGSVIPKFREQISRGGPLTVTHPEITRYFMLIPEAAQLVLEAACMGEGGEIFVLDMGEPVKIVNLARDMIRLSGYSEREIRIVFTGLRPGEKLYEELLASDELTTATRHPKVRMATARAVPEGEWDELVRWLEASHGLGAGEVRRQLRRWIPEYDPPPVALKVVAVNEAVARR